jgi:predicted pyridoxine 5'-phosphate oxidase superfamily flavin-nucleotide-binding protein
MSSPGEKPRITDAMRADVSNSVLCWLATVGADGTPNVTPKEIFCFHGEHHVVVADIASANSVANIRRHPKVCVSFIDVFRQRGFRITGAAAIISPQDVGFAEAAAGLLERAGPDFPVRNVISIAIGRVSRIWAPSYSLFPERTEEERMQAAYDTYGVMPKGD